jgi:putative membrane protein
MSHVMGVISSMPSMPVRWWPSPLLLPIGLLLLIEEVGLRRLALRMSAQRAATWRRRALLYEGSLIALGIVASSPLMGLSMEHLWIHMILHVIEMFYLPVLLVLGAPFVPALFSMPIGLRRRVISWWCRGRWRWLTGGSWRLLTTPVVSVLLFNGLMVLWHVPAVFDAAGRYEWVHTWLMTPSFVLSGYLFWRVILPSHPVKERGSLKVQTLSVIGTAFVMLFLAISMAVLSRAAWYQMNIEMLGPSEAFHDQQLAAGILWICGDFWSIPALVLIVRRVIQRDGSLSETFERSLGRV